MDYDYDADAVPQSLLWEGLRRREPSSGSGIDDVDLADYSKTLQRGQEENINHFQTSNSHTVHTTGRAPTARHEGLEYPPAPVFSRPFSVDGYLSSPNYPQSPSIVYHHESYPGQFPVDPKSLPHFFAPLSPPTATPDSLATPRTPNTETDIDISHFPAYTRAWYEKPSTSYLNNSSKRSDGSGVPWDLDRDNAAGSSIDPITKRERIRMLEHEFGNDAVETGKRTGPMLGSVDANGKLITAGPKKRALVRWAQGLLALLGGASAIYGALVCLIGCRALII